MGRVGDAHVDLSGGGCGLSARTFEVTANLGKVAGRLETHLGVLGGKEIEVGLEDKIIEGGGEERKGAYVRWGHVAHVYSIGGFSIHVKGGMHTLNKI